MKFRQLAFACTAAAAFIPAAVAQVGVQPGPSTAPGFSSMQPCTPTDSGIGTQSGAVGTQPGTPSAQPCVGAGNPQPGVGNPGMPTPQLGAVVPPSGTVVPEPDTTVPQPGIVGVPGVGTTARGTGTAGAAGAR